MQSSIRNLSNLFLLFLGHLEPEQVLNLRQISGEVEKTGLENNKRKQRFQWTVQRIRLSPRERHLAASLKCTHTEELR